MSFWQDKRVLVTGGAGLIGSYVVARLVKKGAVVRVVDDLSRGRLRNLEGVDETIDLGIADLRLLPVAIEGCRGQNIVIHLASPSYGVEWSGRSHGRMLTDTTLMGMNVLEGARRAEVDRVMVVSSSCVYPDNAPVPTPESWGKVGSPEHANLGYGWAKRVLEMQADFYRKEYLMDVRVARPFNTYGPRVPVYGDGRDHLLVALIVRALQKGESEPLTVWGSGDQTRAFLHAETVARILVTLTAGTWSYAGPVNVGSNWMVPVKDLAKMILTHLGQDSQALLFDRTKPEGAPNKAADGERLQKLLRGTRFHPRTLEDGIAELCEYVRSELERKEKEG